MAGDWIKMRSALQHDPKVSAIARHLLRNSDVTLCATSDAMLRNAVIGALHGVWCAVNEHAIDGVVSYGDASWVDHACGIPEFGLAMQKVGWVIIESDRIIFPKFNDNNTSAAERQRRYRENKAGISNNVARNGDVTRCATGGATVAPREEKSKRRIRKEKEEEIDQEKEDVCVETDQPSSTPLDSTEGESPVLVFPCDGNPNAWGLTESQITQWNSLYPSLDVLSECRKALAWVLAGSDRRKTARGMPKFLVGWLGRTQDKGGKSNGTNKQLSSSRVGPGQRYRED